MKKASGVIIILSLHNKKHDMIYAYSDVDCDRHNYSSFKVIFALLPHYWPLKIKTWKNVKNTGRYYPVTHVYYKSRSYDV